jgi:hypothetical protein
LEVVAWFWHCPEGEEMSNFPLLTRAGLKVIETLYYGERQWIEAADVERWLEQAPVLTGKFDGTKPGQIELHHEKYEWATHSVRAVLIEPLVQDTAESLLREFVRRGVADEADFHDLFTRARKLLEGK